MFFGIGLVLAVPFTAMLFTSEVQWSLFDFAVAALLLSAVAISVELVLRTVKSTPARWLSLGAVLVGFVLLWLELAVGLLGSPLAGN